jgi:uncharacterized RDD family membrane protein YckC/cytoskeletal protein CcmA (bactofilin family)
MRLNNKIILGALIVAGFIGAARAGDVSMAITTDAASSAYVAGADAGTANDGSGSGTARHILHFRGKMSGSNDRDRVSIAHNQILPAGEHADNVVSVLASANVEGDVAENVVSVLGNARVTGPVDGDVVAVLGNAFIDSRVDGDVVAVLGKVELGPHADVGGEISSVGGSVVRDPAAITHGDVDIVSGGAEGFDFGWFQKWVTSCLLKGRLLAFTPGVSWAWTIALISLLFYVLTALAMRRSVEKYVGVLEAHPGESVIAAFLTLLATPVLFVLLIITMIGILAAPFLALALLLAGSFGRIVIFAWIGTRLLKPTGNDAWSHPAVAVLIGGLIVTALYTVPVIGMITFQLIGFVGMGVVVYGLLLALRNRRQANGVPPHPQMVSPPAAATTAAAAAAAPVPGVAATSEAAPAPAAAAAASIAASGYPRAGFWIRMLALFIDLLLVSVLVHLLLHTGKMNLLFLAAYGAVMWKIRGATLGGIICHLQVVRVDGRELDWTTAIVRALGCFLSLVSLGLGFIWIAIDRDRQGWHDKIAGTLVVRVPKVVPLV